MKLQAFGVCRVCLEVYPSASGCPHCNSRTDSSDRPRGSVVAVASAADSPSPLQIPRKSPRWVPHRNWQWKPLVAVISISVVVSTLIAVLVQA